MRYVQLDRSSKILLAISFFGILSGLVMLYFSSRYIGDNEIKGDKQGVIAKTHNDVRVKRSGNIHWFPANKAITVYEDDSIFTGADSTATLVYVPDGKLTIGPNSLVIIKNGSITINGGSVQIETGSKNLKVNSFGEEFNFEKGQKISLSDDKDGQKISGDNLKGDGFDKFVDRNTIQIISPESAKLVPKIDQHHVNFSWKNTKTQNPVFIAEFSKSKKFTSVFISKELKTTSLILPIKDLGLGTVYWRVRTKDGIEQNESYFYVIEDFAPSYLTPSGQGGFPIEQAQIAGVQFEWTNPIEYPQRMQISREKDFKTIHFESRDKELKKQVRFKVGGTYYWRVGYVEDENVLWMPGTDFNLKSDIIYSPLEILHLPSRLDFALIDSYELKIQDQNLCDEYKVTLYKEGKFLSESKIKNNQVNLSKIADGNYGIKIEGMIQNIKVTESKYYEFVVKTSPPEKMPTIRNKKAKLFVQIMKRIIDFVIPSAAANEHIFKWEGEDQDTYEIEVSANSHENIVVTQQLKKKEFSFNFPGPGIYYWRVRTWNGEKWGKFTDYSELVVEDRVSQVTTPLMISPKDNTNFVTPIIKGKPQSRITVWLNPFTSAEKILEAESDKVKEVKIPFKWNTPYPDMEYYIEIYKNETSPPLRPIKLKGNSATLKLKDLPTIIWWRIFAKSSFGTQSNNSTRYKITFSEREPDLELANIKQIKVLEEKAQKKKREEKKKDQESLPANPSLPLNIRATAFYAISSYEQKDESNGLDQLAKKASLTGPRIHLHTEYWPRKFNTKWGATLGIRYAMYSGKVEKFSDKDLNFEIGRVLKDSSTARHSLFLGTNYRALDLAFEPGSQSSYTFVYGTLRYYYWKQWSEKLGWDLNPKLLIPLDFSTFIPSLQMTSAINYNLKSKLWLQGFIGLERMTSKSAYDSGSYSGELSLTSMDISLGVALLWKGF